MTRDEAIAKVADGHDPDKLSGPPTIIVDALAALGVIKLDEPKTVDQVLCGLKVDVENYDDAQCQSALHPMGVSKIIETLTANGFDIVKR